MDIISLAISGRPVMTIIQPKYSGLCLVHLIYLGHISFGPRKATSHEHCIKWGMRLSVKTYVTCEM